MTEYYVLNGHEIVPESSIIAWGEFFNDSERRIVGRTELGDVLVSTVFLGIDHGFGVGAPILFETMVFGGPLNDETVRYSTWTEAERGHTVMVERVREVSA